MAKEPSLPYNLMIAGKRRDEFIPFQRVLAQSEMQTALSRIWTWVTDSISFNDNHYALCASLVLVVGELKYHFGLRPLALYFIQNIW